jgi:spore maturation protein CgeB
MVMDSVDRDLGVSVIGKDWGQFVPPGVVRSEFMANDQVGAAYRSAGILLNDHWDDMREEGFISNRLFDAVAAGARVITDDVVGLREVFGKSVQVATTADELEALVRAENRDEVFGTEAERRAAAEIIAREHSFDARAAVLLEDAVASWRARQRQ